MGLCLSLLELLLPKFLVPCTSLAHIGLAFGGHAQAQGLAKDHFGIWILRVHLTSISVASLLFLGPFHIDLVSVLPKAGLLFSDRFEFGGALPAFYKSGPFQE